MLPKIWGFQGKLFFYLNFYLWLFPDNTDNEIVKNSSKITFCKPFGTLDKNQFFPKRYILSVLRPWKSLTKTCVWLEKLKKMENTDGKNYSIVLIYHKLSRFSPKKIKVAYSVFKRPISTF